MFKVKYGPETINEFDDFETAVDWMIDQIELFWRPSTMYVYDVSEDRRYDYLELKRRYRLNLLRRGDDLLS